LPARISGVAKSASDAAKSSRNALARPGVASGSVTVRNTRQRDAPSENAMPRCSSRSPRGSAERQVRDREVGQCLGEQRAREAVDGDALEAEQFVGDEPARPNEKIIAMAVVNGGETSGSSTLHRRRRAAIAAAGARTR
jgi:hypothetical protein